SDGDEIPRSSDGRAEARRLRHFRQSCHIEIAELRECVRCEMLACKIRNDRRQIADRAVPINDAGLFSAGRAEANEFHGCKKSLGFDPVMRSASNQKMSKLPTALVLASAQIRQCFAELVI